MLLLGASVNNKIEVVTDASADIEVDVSWMDASTSTWAVNGGDSDPLTSITTATTTPIKTGAASTLRSIRNLSLRNNHASTSCNITVQKTDGTDTVTLFKCNLLAGELAVRTATGQWLHYDANGGIYPSIGAAASQAEMEAGTATDRYVTPQGVNWHPGVCKSWAKSKLSAGVPQMTVTWNMTSITDSAVCRVTPVIATDFSGADYVILYGFECNTTTYSATTTALIPTVRNATPTATQFTIDLVEIDIGQTTDPASWFWACWGDQ